MCDVVRALMRRLLLLLLLRRRRAAHQHDGAASEQSHIAICCAAIGAAHSRDHGALDALSSIPDLRNAGRLGPTLSPDRALSPKLT